MRASLPIYVSVKLSNHSYGKQIYSRCIISRQHLIRIDAVVIYSGNIRADICLNENYCEPSRTEQRMIRRYKDVQFFLLCQGQNFLIS